MKGKIRISFSINPCKDDKRLFASQWPLQLHMVCSNVHCLIISVILDVF